MHELYPDKTFSTMGRPTTAVTPTASMLQGKCCAIQAGQPSMSKCAAAICAMQL